MAILNGAEIQFELPQDSFEDVIEANLLPKLMSSKYYSLITDHVIEEQNQSLMQKVINQLNSRDLEIEAADFWGRYSDSHPTFNTVVSAVGFLKNWFKS